MTPPRYLGPLHRSPWLQPDGTYWEPPTEYLDLPRYERRHPSWRDRAVTGLWTAMDGLLAGLALASGLALVRADPNCGGVVGCVAAVREMSFNMLTITGLVAAGGNGLFGILWLTRRRHDGRH